MTKSRIYLSIALLPLLSVPWFFGPSSSAVVLGFPIWALYSLAITLLFSLLLCWILQRYWSLLAEDESDVE